MTLTFFYQGHCGVLLGKVVRRGHWGRSSSPGDVMRASGGSGRMDRVDEKGSERGRN